ncbi:MAG: type IV pilin protein [Myxococcales bacterium]|nr:type IV pilin protein [Myxococcales bacterium]
MKIVTWLSAGLATSVLLGGLGCKGASNQYMCRARQAEAKAGLASLHSAQSSYHAANKKYAGSLKDLAAPAVPPRYYELAIASASDKGYVATATGKDQAAGDVWTIDQSGKPTAKVDKCEAKP